MIKKTADFQRADYRKYNLDIINIDKDPFKQFKKWFDEINPEKTDELSTMCLSTVSIDNRPSGRIVLLRNFDERGFVFFTHYESRKGAEIAANPYAALTFLWIQFERQVRIEGSVSKLNEQESDDYFESRPQEHKIGAWASRQSKEIMNRNEIENAFENCRDKFKEGQIKRPSCWGGFRVIPDRFEFWQGRENRLHDRLLFTPGEDKSWKITRLAP